MNISNHIWCSDIYYNGGKINNVDVWYIMKMDESWIAEYNIVIRMVRWQFLIGNFVEII